MEQKPRRDFSALKNQLGGANRKKPNSTNTFKDPSSTLSQPCEMKLMKAVCHHIQKIMKDPKKDVPSKEFLTSFESFDESKNPIGVGPNSEPMSKEMVNVLPKIEDIEDFASSVYDTGRMSAESLILFVGYINRIIKTTNFAFYPCNYRRVILAGFLISCKVWEDDSVWNVDFAGLANKKDLKLLEAKFIECLKFDVSISPSDFAKLYFELTTQGNLKEEEKKTLKMIDPEIERRLQLYNDNLRKKSQTSGEPAILVPLSPLVTNTSRKNSSGSTGSIPYPQSTQSANSTPRN